MLQKTIINIFESIGQIALQKCFVNLVIKTYIFRNLFIVSNLQLFYFREKWLNKKNIKFYNCNIKELKEKIQSGSRMIHAARRVSCVQLTLTNNILQKGMKGDINLIFPKTTYLPL